MPAGRAVLITINGIATDDRRTDYEDHEIDHSAKNDNSSDRLHPCLVREPIGATRDDRATRFPRGDNKK